MSRWFDNMLVGLALLVSVGYAIAALGPRALKQRLLAALVGRLAGTWPFLGLLNIARRLQAKSAAKAAAQTAGACGGCDNCGSGSTTTLPAAQAAVGDVRIPVAKIGRRS
jgi:hypothetical protein